MSGPKKPPAPAPDSNDPVDGSAESTSHEQAKARPGDDQPPRINDGLGTVRIAANFGDTLAALRLGESIQSPLKNSASQIWSVNNDSISRMISEMASPKSFLSLSSVWEAILPMSILPDGYFKNLIPSALPETKWLTNFADIQSNVLQGLVPSLFGDQLQSLLPTFQTSLLGFDPFKGIDFDALKTAIRRGQLPSNWHDVDVEIDDVGEIVEAILDDGVPLAWVPDARVVQRLLAAPTPAARRRVISDNHRGIVNHCERLTGSLPAPGALYYADMIRRSIAAFRDGHVEASQALASNTLDTILTQHTRDALSVGLGALTNPSYREKLTKEGWRIVLALRPLHVVMSGSFNVQQRVTPFRRNATTHAATRHQYTRVNATIAIMLATSVLTCYVRDTSAFD